MEQRHIRVSVRNLVEFILRAGDIDNRHGAPGADKEAMLAGGRIHRKIQGGKGSNYQAEVSLKRVFSRDGYDLLVEGRADGILTEKEQQVTVDEIKGVYRDIHQMEAPDAIHLAQAKCYACMYGVQEGLSNIRVQMTYVNLETEDVRYFRQDFSVEELEEWMQALVADYGKWTDFQVAWEETRNASARTLEFPFPYRKGQRELAVSVYRTISRRKRLFIQAPTGVGKTMSVLFPAVKAFGENLGEKIFYLTARTVTAQAARDAFDILEGQGLRVKRVFLTAKEKLCPLEEPLCDPEHCLYARGHYDRVNEAVYAFLQSHDHGGREELLDWAEQYLVCPFEFTLDVSSFADAVVGDYNYAFSPTVRLKRFFGEGMKGDYIFLMDEAHNLVDRSREMFSAALCKEDFLAMKKLAKPVSRKLERALEKCNRYLLERKRECQDYERLQDITPFLTALLSLTGIMEQLLEEERAADIAEPLREFYFQVSAFLNIADRLGPGYVIYTEHGSDGRFWIHEFCIDPSENLRECLDKGCAAVFFSATLLPVNYYKKLLSGETEDYGVYIPSPFDAGKRQIVIGRDVSSRYTRRNAEEYGKIAGYIREITGQKNGNYLVFFPSYQYMEQVYDAFTEGMEEVPGMRILRQSGQMREADREAFLEAFRQNRQDLLLGFCVMGGIFSEGIDLREDSLIGAIIVGTGLPMVCREREILKTYFEERQEDGFAFAYLYPGMNKVQQAAGRVIRTEQDQGVIALLDDRFLQSVYQRTFPTEWQEYAVCTKDTVGGAVRDFWEQAGKLPDQI